MARIPGIYVSIQGDVTQLNADLGKARRMVKEAADDISNALGNALKPQQINKGIDQMIGRLNELSNHSKLLTTNFDGLSVELGSLQRLTGMTGESFAKLQSKFFETQVVKTAERALSDLGKALNLDAQSVANLGAQFNLSETSILKVTGALGRTEQVSMSVAKAVGTAAKAWEMAERATEAASTGFEGMASRLRAALAEKKALEAQAVADSEVAAEKIKVAFVEKLASQKFGFMGNDIGRAFNVPMESFQKEIDTFTAKIDAAFASIGRYVQKPQVFKNPAYGKQFWDAILPGEVPLDDLTAKIDAAFNEIEARAKRAQAKGWLSYNSAAEKAANQTKAIFASLAAQEAEANKGVLSFQSAVSSSMSSVEAKLLQAAQAFNMPKEQVDQLRAKAQRQIELKIKTDTLKQLAQEAGLAKKQIAELEKQFGVTLTESSGLLGGKSFGDILKNTFAYGTAYQLLGTIQQMPGEIIKVVAQLDALKASFMGVFGDEAAEQFEYAVSVANKYGKSIESVAGSYKKFAAATEYVGLSSNKTKAVFEAVTQAVTKVGGSSEDVSGTLLALQQMISKGTVSAEEFRLQFAERIPGAMKMGADALGVTTSKFKSMMESGEVIATDFIPKLAVQLGKFSEGWQSAAGSIESNWERLKNSVTLASASFFEVFVTAGDIKDLEKRVAQVVDVVNSGLKKIKPPEEQSGYLTQAVKAAISVTPLGRVVRDDSQYLPKADTSNVQRLEELKAQAQKTASEIADILAKPADISPDSGKRVQELQDKLNETLKTIHSLCDQPWQAQFTANVDTSQLERAVALIDKLYKASAQGGVATAAAQLKTVESGVTGLQDQLKQLDKQLEQAAGSSPIVNNLLKQRLGVESELKKTGAAINEARSNYLESLKRFSKEETATPFGDLDRKSSGNTKSEALAKEAEDYEKRKAAATARYEEDQRNARTISADEYDKQLKRLAADHNSARMAIEKQHNRGANAAAHHAVAVEKLNDTLENYLAKQMGLASDDILGAKFADIAAKADNLRAKAKDLAIAGGVDLKTFFSDLDKAVSAAKVKATDDFLEKLFPWLKKDDTLNAAKAALDENSKSYAILKERAEAAGLSIEYVRKVFTDKTPLVEYQKELAKIKFDMENTSNFSSYKNSRDHLTNLEYKSGGTEERKTQEDLLKTYDELTGKMYQLKADMYARIVEAARAAGMDEAKVQAILTEQMEDAAKQQLETQAKYSTSFGETLSAKWSLAYGGYKSAATKARDDWNSMSDSVISTTNGMIDGIAGGFGDLIRNIGNGTASIEDLWKNMLARMLDAFASFVEDLIKQQLKDLVGGWFGSSGSQPSAASSVSSLFGSSLGSPSSSSDLSALWKGFGKEAGTGMGDYLTTAASNGETIFGSKDVLSKIFGDGLDMSKLGTSELWNTSSTAVSAATMAGTYSTAETAAMSAGSLLSTVGSVLGVVGGVAGVVGLVAGLFGEQQKKEVKKVASGYNVQYASGRTVTSGVDFYSDNSVVSTGVGDPDVTKKISDAFRNAAEQLSDFADVLGFTVDILQGFKMPAMNITDSQLDTYIRNGTNAEAFQALEQAGLRGAFDKLAQDGEVYIDEVERLSTAYSTGSAKLSAYGYQMADVAQVTQGQIDELRAQTIETAAGTSDAIQAMAQSMGATSDQLAQLAANASDGSQALAVTDEQLSNLLEADWVSKVEDAVGGEDAFNSIMDNLLKNVFDSIDAYAANLGYYNEMASKYISRLGDDSITVDNFWNKFNEALKNGLDPDQFEAWSKASTWVNSINTVTDAVDKWNEGMLQLDMSLDARSQKARGLSYEASITSQLASAEKELYDAREAGYDATYIARLQEVQALELQALIIQHQEDYAKEMRDATKRYATAIGDNATLVSIQMQENAKELSDLAKTYNWSVGSAEDGLFQAVQRAQWAELINTITDQAEALNKATESLKTDIAARRASIEGLDAESEAIQKLSSYQAELTQAYKDGVGSDLIAQLQKLQIDEMAKYWADTINDLKKELGEVGDTIADRLEDIKKRFTDFTNGQLTQAQTALSVAQSAADAYKSASSSIEDAMDSLRKSNEIADPKLNYQNAYAAFQTAYLKGVGGDTQSLQNAGSLAQDLMDAAGKYFADSGLYSDTYASVMAKLGELDTVSASLGIAGDYQASLLKDQVEILTQINSELAKANPDTAQLQAMVAGLGVVSGLLAGTRNVYITDDATAAALRTAVNAQTGQTVQIGNVTMDQLKSLKTYSAAQVDATGEVADATLQSNLFLATQQGLLESGNATQDILRQFSAQNISVSQDIKNAILGDSNVANAYLATVSSATSQLPSLLGQFLQVTAQQRWEQQRALQQAQVAAAQSRAQTLYNQAVSALQGSTIGQLTSSLATTGAGWQAVAGVNARYPYSQGMTSFEWIQTGHQSIDAFVSWYLQNYGSGSGYVDWSSAMSLLSSMGILPSNVSSLMSQYQSAYQSYINLKNQYGFATGGVIADGTISGDTTLSFTNKKERVLTDAQNRAFEKIAYQGGSDSVLAELKAIKDENKALRSDVNKLLFAIAANTGNVSRKSDDWNRRGVPTRAAEV